MRALHADVGQLLMVGFEGHEPSPELRQLIRDAGVGGVILFARNVAEPAQVADLVRELQGLARDAGHARPLLLGVDQEGGRVARLKGQWAAWPPLRAVGRIASEETASRLGAALAEQVASCGLHLDFAPVVDVDTNPRNPVIGDRSFGDDPELVGRLAAAFIRGMQTAGVAACAKHFPGHGDTDVDSHLALPCVDHSRARLDDIELRPFRAAVASEVATIMTAHVLVRELDDRLPATLSPHVLGALLRVELGYDGVVVSDDLEMKAVAAGWRPGVAAPLAVAAGCDLLLVCKSADAQAEAHEGLVKAVEEGVIRRQVLDDACARVRRLKERYAVPRASADPKHARLTAASAAHRALAEELAARSGVEV
jgi:beta-N-acetylhexosaminidase